MHLVSLVCSEVVLYNMYMYMTLLYGNLYMCVDVQV